MSHYKLSLNSFPKTTFTGSSSLPLPRPHSEISLVSATNREFDLRDRLNHFDRKQAKQNRSEEERWAASQKWKYKVERNIVLKDYKQTRATTNQITPSIDDWLRMNSKTRHQYPVVSANELHPKQ
jgi:hypothetical protein